MIAEDSDRLFASIDEVLFEAPEQSASPLRERQDGDLIQSSGSPLSSFRFFITTDSRSPELNVFNRPRVSLWPINPDEAPSSWSNPPFSSTYDLWTAKDKLLAYCATIGKGSSAKPLYFQRRNAFHPTFDYKQIPRNQELYRYLVEMTDRELPRVGRSFDDKYGDNRYAILTMMFDYVRSSINILNSGEGWGETVQERKAMRRANEYSFPAGGLKANQPAGSGFASVIPIRIEEDGVTTKGIGRFPTLTGAHIQLYATGQTRENNSGTQQEVKYRTLINEWRSYLNGSSSQQPPSTIRRRFRLVFLINLFNPVEGGNVSQNPRFQYEVLPEGGAFAFAEANPDLLPDGVNGNAALISSGNAAFLGSADRFYASTTRRGNYNNDAGYLGVDQATLRWREAWDPRGSEPKEFGGSLDERFFPFVSQEIEVEYPVAYQEDDGSGNLVWRLRYDDEVEEAKDPPLIGFSGGNVTVNVYAGAEFQGPDFPRNHDVKTNGPNQNYPLNDETRIQSFQFQLPAVELPIPLLGEDRYVRTGTAETFEVTIGSDEEDFPYRYTPYQLRDYQLRGRYTRQGDMILRAGMPITEYDPTTYTELGVDTNGDGDYDDQGEANGINHGWPMDVVRGIGIDGGTGVYGDMLYAAARPGTFPPAWFTPAERYSVSEQYIAAASRGVFYGGWNYWEERLDSNPATDGPSTWFGFQPGLNWKTHGGGHIGDLPVTTWSSTGIRRRSASGGWTSPGIGDFNNGIGTQGPGSFIPYIDTGWPTRGTIGGSQEFRDIPYLDLSLIHSGWDNNSMENHHGLTFSPTRQIPSAMRFGWIPSRPLAAVGGESPWENLLFSPQPLGGRESHRGWAESPRDHYFLDLFWMPVVEPYAISEPFSTAGKINLNYQIAPFTYMRRATGLHAVLKSLELVAPVDSMVGPWNQKNKSLGDYFHDVDVEETLKTFEYRFANNEPFVTASEITEVDLYPEGGPSWSAAGDSMEAWWDDRRIAGDNLREMPYDHIYPRVCVRSNAFKVHMRVQTVKMTPQGRINPTSEYRGEEVLERYLDPNLASYGDASSANVDAQFPPLNEHYRFRQVNRRRFGP